MTSSLRRRETGRIERHARGPAHDLVNPMFYLPDGGFIELFGRLRASVSAGGGSREILCSGGVPVSTVRSFSRAARRNDDPLGAGKCAAGSILFSRARTAAIWTFLSGRGGCNCHRRPGCTAGEARVAPAWCRAARRTVPRWSRGAIGAEPYPWSHDGERANIVALPGAKEPLHVRATRCEEP